MNAATNTSDRQAEMAVLGGILLRPDLLATLPRLESDDFAHSDTRALFDAMRNCEADGVPIDTTMLGDQLRKAGKLEGADGYAFMGEVSLRCTTPDNVEHYAEILHRHRIARQFVLACGAAISAVTSGETEGVEAVGELQSALIRIESNEQEDQRVTSFADLVRKEYGAIEDDLAARKRGEMAYAGMPTGLTNVDRKTGGCPFGLMTIVAARPGQGKTTLMMRLSWAAWHLGQDTPVVASYEDGGRSFGQRLIAQQSGVRTEVVRAREFEREQFDAIKRHTPTMLERGDLLITASGMPVTELCRRVKALRRRRTGKIGEKRTIARLVCVDYIQRIPLPPMNGSKSDRMGENSKRLVDLAATEDIAVIVGSQLNREIEKRAGGEPQLSDLRDCGELEADGKFVIAPHRESPHSSELKLHVLKNHNGESHFVADAFWHLATHTICNGPTDLPWLAGRK